MSATHATSIPQLHKVLNSGQLPDGERFIEVSCLNYDAYTALPDGMTYEGRTYLLTGWNSDRQVAYYKVSDRFAVATHDAALWRFVASSPRFASMTVDEVKAELKRNGQL